MSADPESRPAGLLSTVADAPINILIVDDEPKNLTVLETVLDLPGYRLVRAESADQALLALMAEEFALLILDVRMPSMTGFELAQVIKGRKKTARVPIIFLTAYYNEDQHVLEGYESGAVDYLHKPVNAAVLRSKVAVFADLHRKSREITISNRALIAEVTDRRRAEQQLQELNEHLDSLVLERTQSLRELQAELRANAQRKDEFLATLAHELRNPLAPIRNAIYVLQRDDVETSVSRRMRDIVARQVAVMARLIDDLMDVSRINRGRIDLQREVVDISRVVELAIEASRPLIDEAGHRLTVIPLESALLVEGDATRLAQVFVNLLTNAAKYTDGAGSIELSLRQIGAEVEISVKDDGIGIDSNDLDKVFVMFAQAEGGMSRSRGGLGIGLSLVKHVVGMHGGRVDAQSSGLGKGSTFRVCLPAKVASTNQVITNDWPHASSVASSPADALRVLVVDDHCDGAESLGRLLSLLGHEVRIAHDGTSALAQAEAFVPSIVVLDIGLPDMDGYEVCRQLRSQTWAADLAVVALSGWGDEESKRQGQLAGFNGHLVKPVEESSLVAALAGLAKGPNRDLCRKLGPLEPP